MQVVLFGANGQMGRVLHELWKERHPSDTLILIDQDLPNGTLDDIKGADVLVDFSHASSLPELLAYGDRTKTPLVIATTGHDKEGGRAIEAASQRVPIFHTANLSFGIFALRALTREAAKLLGKEVDVEIIERHHNRKQDAPSGTALVLVNAVGEVRSTDRTVYGRHGDAPRIPGEIGIHAIRGGSITGEHTVLFALEGETLELTHRAESKRLYALGALKAAEFVMSRDPGLYGMDDLIKEA